ncbi:diguanylate cyclase [Humidesulfovibrio sp.]
MPLRRTRGSLAAECARPAWSTACGRRARLAVLCCLCLGALLLARPEEASGQPSGVGSPPQVMLNSKEQAYLRENPSVPLCVDPDWPPFERINEQGQHEGIAADLLALVSVRTGLRFELLHTATWEESLEAAATGRCKVLSFLNVSPKREQWLLFTEPLLNDPNVFITREEHPYIADPAGLDRETIAVPVGSSVEELLRRSYPNLTVVTTQTEDEALALVSERKADMTMRSLIVAASTIRKQGLFNLKIAGQIPDYGNRLRMGVVKDEPVLRAILDKGVATITPRERDQSVARHTAINVQMGVDYSLVAKVALAALAALAVALYWTLRLRSLNRELKRLSETDLLTGLYNRSLLDARLREEFERARRYNRPLSLVMLDIDRFKAINDEFGHLMGDKMLQAIAARARASLRATDILGRWGGEEFLVLCPETVAKDAHAVAERIRAAVAEGEYPSGRTHSVSAGVASMAAQDSVDTLLQRADTALYQAKNSGRDQVCGDEA